MSETEEAPIEERLRDAMEEYREVKDEELEYGDDLQIIVDERKDALQDVVVEAEGLEPAAGTELAILLAEANEMLEETQGGKRRRRKTKKSKGKSKKSKSKSKKSKSKTRKTRRRLL
jgi:hypothetical protein